MLKFNRRRFMQVTGATGLACALHALATTATAAQNGKTPSQMLWSSLYSKAASPMEFSSVTDAMGISRNASQGIYAKLNHA